MRAAISRAKHASDVAEGFSLEFPRCCDRAVHWLVAERLRAAHQLPVAKWNRLVRKKIHNLFFLILVLSGFLGGA